MPLQGIPDCYRIRSKPLKDLVITLLPDVSEGADLYCNPVGGKSVSEDAWRIPDRDHCIWKTGKPVIFDSD